MPTAEQGDLLPFASPETALALCRQQQQQILTIAPDVWAQEWIELLGEQSLTSVCLERIMCRVLASPEYRARQLATPVIPLERAEQILPAWRRIARRRPSIAHSWRT